MATEFDSVLFSGILAGVLGLYALLTGWSMVRSSDKARPMYFKLGVVITLMILGRNAAIERESKLMDPSRIRRHGILRIITGGVFLISGGLQLLGLYLL
jgi:hypothetical protein